LIFLHQLFFLHFCYLPWHSRANLDSRVRNIYHRLEVLRLSKTIPARWR
jgi:hypothetical protein